MTDEAGFVLGASSGMYDGENDQVSYDVAFSYHAEGGDPFLVEINRSDYFEDGTFIGVTRVAALYMHPKEARQLAKFLLHMAERAIALEGSQIDSEGI